MSPEPDSFSRLERRLAAAFPEVRSRVGIYGENSSEYFAVLRAIIGINRIAVPIPTHLNAESLERHSRTAELSGIVCFNDAPPDPGALRCVSVYELEGLEKDAQNLLRPATQDTALLIFTSGSSGEPKAVVITHGAIRAHAESAAAHLGLAGDDCWLVCLPFYHVGGLMIPFRCIAAGCSFLVSAPRDVTTINAHLESGEITFVSVVAKQLKDLLDLRQGQPFPNSLKAVIVGGGGVAHELLERCPIALPTYGLTETCSMIACARPGSNRAERFSSGSLLPGVTIRFKTFQDPQSESLNGGTICVATPSLASGYWNDGSASQRVYSDQGFVTGDTGFLDAHGFLHVTGREDEMFKSGGEKIHPAEIARELESHPSVHSAIVVGIPDAEWGMAAAAWIVSNPKIPANEEELRAYLRAQLSVYKIPKRWLFAENYPVLANEKPDLQEIRRRLST